MDKEKTQNEILEIVNNTLKKYNEPFELDRVAILNTSKGVSFLGNFRVYDDNNLKNVSKDVESKLAKLAKLTFNSKMIKPCCEPPFNHASFELVFEN